MRQYELTVLYPEQVADLDLQIYLYPFTGQADIFVNPNECPENHRQFKWKSRRKSIEILDITPEERKAAGSSDQKFCIQVFTNSFSSYVIGSQFLDKNNLALSFNEPQQGRSWKLIKRLVTR